MILKECAAVFPWLTNPKAFAREDHAQSRTQSAMAIELHRNRAFSLSYSEPDQIF
jgi:hypothetical protein